MVMLNIDQLRYYYVYPIINKLNGSYCVKEKNIKCFSADGVIIYYVNSMYFEINIFYFKELSVFYSRSEIKRILKQLVKC